MSNTQTTGNATKQPIPQYPPAINIGGGMGGLGGLNQYGLPTNEIVVDTVNQLRDKVIELDGKIQTILSLMRKV